MFFTKSRLFLVQVSLQRRKRDHAILAFGQGFPDKINKLRICGINQIFARIHKYACKDVKPREKYKKAKSYLIHKYKKYKKL